MPWSKAKTAEVEERRSRVAQLWKARYTYRQIAQALNVSKSTVNNDVKAILKQWQEEQLANVEAQRARDVSTIDEGIRALWQDYASGNIQAVHAMVKLIDRRAKIFGYDGPIRTEVDAKLSTDKPLELRNASVDDFVAEYLPAIERALSASHDAGGVAEEQPVDTAQADAQTG